MFLCRELDYGERWHYDQFDIDCTNAKHLFFQFLAVIGAVVYPFGIPLYFFVGMYRNRVHLKGEDTTETHNVASQTDLMITNRVSAMHRDTLFVGIREGNAVVRDGKFAKRGLRYRLKRTSELNSVPNV